MSCVVSFWLAFIRDGESYFFVYNFPNIPDMLAGLCWKLSFSTFPIFDLKKDILFIEPVMSAFFDQRKPQVLSSKTFQKTGQWKMEDSMEDS